MINNTFNTIKPEESKIATLQQVEESKVAGISELDILQLVHRMYGGVSTAISRELCQMLGIVPSLPFELHSYKIST